MISVYIIASVINIIVLLFLIFLQGEVSLMKKEQHGLLLILAKAGLKDLEFIGKEKSFLFVLLIEILKHIKNIFKIFWELVEYILAKNII